MSDDRHNGRQCKQPYDGLTAGRRNRFSRARRLCGNRDFSIIYESGRSYAARSMVLWVLPSGEGQKKAGVVASRRMFRRAVDRNRAKRLLRENIRCLIADIKPGYRLVLIARRGLLQAPQDEVAKDLRWLLRRAGVLLCAEY